MRCAALAVGKRTRLQFRNKGRVAGQDSKIAVASRNLRFLGVDIPSALVFMGDDFELEGIWHFVFAARI